MSGAVSVAAVRAECVLLQRGVVACRARVVLQPGACGQVVRW